MQGKCAIRIVTTDLSKFKTQLIFLLETYGAYKLLVQLQKRNCCLLFQCMTFCLQVDYNSCWHGLTYFNSWQIKLWVPKMNDLVQDPCLASSDLLNPCHKVEGKCDRIRSESPATSRVFSGTHYSFCHRNPWKIIIPLLEKHSSLSLPNIAVYLQALPLSFPFITKTFSTGDTRRWKCINTMLSTSCIVWLHKETGWETNNCITLMDKGQNSPRTGKHNKDTDKRKPRNRIYLDLKTPNNQTPLMPPPSPKPSRKLSIKGFEEMTL